jgi:hypothetical protein
LPVLTLSPPAWPFCLPLTLTLTLPAILCLCHYSGLSTLACLYLSFACSCCCNKHCYFNTVCIWVLPEIWYILIPHQRFKTVRLCVDRHGLTLGPLDPWTQCWEILAHRPNKLCTEEM